MRFATTTPLVRFRIVRVDHDLFLLHQRRESSGLLHQFFHVAGHDLPADAKFVFAPATLFVFGVS